MQRGTDTGDKGTGQLPCLQEQKDYRRETAHNRPKSTAMDGIGCEQFVLSVEVLVSDKRRRDLDGMLATICDVIVATGRQLESDAEDHDKREAGGEGRGGCDSDADKNLPGMTGINKEKRKKKVENE